MFTRMVSSSSACINEFSITFAPFAYSVGVLFSILALGFSARLIEKLSTSTASFAFTSPALTLSLIVKQIITTEGMSVFAVSFLRVLGSGIVTAVHILLGCNKLQMYRVATRRAPAKMIYFSFCSASGEGMY